MSGGLKDLANRMRAAVEEQGREARLAAEAAARLELERQRYAAEAAAARDAALAELEAFGEALGLLEVKRTKKPQGLRFERDGRVLGFVVAGDQIAVTGAAEGVLLSREADGTWLVLWPGDEPVRRPLEAGLEELLVTVLGFPRARPAPKQTTKAAKSKPTVHTLVVDTEGTTGRKAKGEAPLVGGSIREFKGPLD